MGIVVFFAQARASTGGYRSGRNSCRGIPEIRSTAKNRKGGTSSHCETACGVIPRGSANAPIPPAALIARSKAPRLSSMVTDSSIACGQNQVLLHCKDQALLYDIDMSLGKRLRKAR